MKFSDMQYARPDFDALFEQMQGLLEEMKDAPTADAYFEAGIKLDRLGSNLQTQGALANIRHTINTKDEFYDKEKDIFDEQGPRFQEISTQNAAIALSSPFRKDIEERYGKHLLEKYELALKTFKPEIVEDLVEENKVASEYEKLLASAEIHFDGGTYNLSGMTPFMQSFDRDVRHRANDASYGWLAQRQEQLDELYDKLVKIRDRIGKKLGFESFIPVAYARMGRTDWNQEDAKVYRDQIVEAIVPLTQKLYKQQSKRLGIKDMKNFDYALEFLTGNPKPRGDEDYLVPQATKMYHELSPETGAFFDIMTGWQLMDLTTKPGKAGGGYMTFLPDYKVPFIFSNFNGTSGDVDVLTHEAGHAFQGYLQRDVEPSDLKEYTMEVAEIHSMSMEFFTHPWMEHFFGDDTQKYYYSHVADAIKFLPYGASIDELQEWVYEHPEATAEERRFRYRLIEKKYLPHIDYNGFEYLEKGGRWQRQHHVYSLPFYYLDYTISQVCAFQYFVWDKKNHEEAWQSYLKVCRLAGQVPFKELAKECGLLSPFEPGAIASITPALEEYFATLDMSKIK